MGSWQVLGGVDCNRIPFEGQHIDTICFLILLLCLYTFTVIKGKMTFQKTLHLIRGVTSGEVTNILGRPVPREARGLVPAWAWAVKERGPQPPR